MKITIFYEKRAETQPLLGLLFLLKEYLDTGRNTPLLLIKIKKNSKQLGYSRFT